MTIHVINSTRIPQRISPSNSDFPLQLRLPSPCQATPTAGQVKVNNTGSLGQRLGLGSLLERPAYVKKQEIGMRCWRWAWNEGFKWSSGFFILVILSTPTRQQQSIKHRHCRAKGTMNAKMGVPSTCREQQREFPAPRGSFFQENSVWFFSKELIMWERKTSPANMGFEKHQEWE